MKKTLLISIVVMVLSLGAIGNNLFAQQQSLIVGVINLPEVLQKHPAMVDEMKMLRDSFEKDAKDVVLFRQNLMKKAEELKTAFRIGTDEYEAQLRPIRDQLREVESQLQEKQNKIQGQVNKLQYRAYVDIMKAIEYVAGQRGIVVVHLRLKLDRANISEEVAALQEADANTVVWARPECDITNDVITVLAQMVGVPKTGASGVLSGFSGGLTPSSPAPGVQQGGMPGNR